MFDQACNDTFDELRAVHKNFTEMVQMLKDDQRRGRSVCSHIESFQWTEVERSMLDAGKLLDKKGYLVAMLGTFSAGKSILVNALLKSPQFLPSAQGVCTLAVTEVRSADATHPEGIVINYLTLEQTYRKVFGSDQFKDQLGPHFPNLSPFDEARARGWVEAAITHYEAQVEDTLKENAIRLRGFLKAVDKYRSRLGQTMTDALGEKEVYLSAQGKPGESSDLAEGHLFLINKVDVTYTNSVLAGEDVRILDLPGVDAPSAHDKEVTFAAIPDADCSLLVLWPRGFAQADQDLVDRISQFSLEIKGKIFVVVNKVDTTNERELVEFETGFYKALTTKLQRMGLSLDKLYFTSAYREELEVMDQLGQLPDARRGELDALRSSMSAKGNSLAHVADPHAKQLLAEIFGNGGVTKLRDELHNYLHRDIKRERVKEVYNRMRLVGSNLRNLLEPERAKIETGANLRRERISKFFNETRERYANIIGTLSAGIAVGVDQINLQFVKEPAGSRVENLVAALNFDAIKELVPVQIPVNVRQKALEVLKPRLMEEFEMLVLSTIPVMVTQKVEKELELVKARDILRHFSTEFREQWEQRYEFEWTYFTRAMKMITRLRVRELMKPIQQLAVGAMPGEGNMWTPALEEAFRKNLNERVKAMVAQFADSLSVLSPYYQELIKELRDQFERLLQEILDAVRDRRFWAVDLPALGLGGGEMQDRERLQVYADKTDAGGNKLSTIRDRHANTLGLSL